ncbi:LOW QUALITY PROTEIN: uncharacterized protein LOC111329941 [Stylophora pistillata]|uniref:LOW QUALITY PROTEIN: uncharacterized protein LOC111329941 n=1 Tax=Stylophora pistillata TaxID=50429 RepID=UPI000C03E431|nr:LOW QUALITY PROTEIN: uncharacterized protein LOC111329941 [Stylophora pistillata]
MGTEYVADLNHMNTLRELTKKLPMFLRAKWTECAGKIIVSDRRPKFGDFVKFIKERAKLVDNEFGHDMNSEPSKETILGRNQGNQSKPPLRSSTFLTGTGSIGGRQNENKRGPDFVKNQAPSLVCSERHEIWKCERFKGFTYGEKRKVVQQGGLCNKCLVKGHIAKECPKVNFKCQKSSCGDNHHTLMHRHTIYRNGGEASADAEQQSRARQENALLPNVTGAGNDREVTVAATGAGQNRVCLGILPVKVQEKASDRMVETYALLDNGSEVTLCHERLAKELKLNGNRLSFTLTGTTGSAQVEGCLVDLVVKSLDESVTVELLNVKTFNDMPISISCIAKTEDLTWRPHLRDIDIPVLEYGEVLLLIGLKENPGLFLPLECKSGVHDEPIAIRYSLGWTVMGPMEGQKGDHGCSVNFVRTKESQWRQRGVHANTEPFEHLCNGSRLDSETGLMERNADVIKEQEQAVSSVKGPENNEEGLQIHVNVLRPKENAKHHTDDEILHRQLERLWKTDFGDSSVGIDTLPSIEDNKALDKMEQSLQGVGDHSQVALPWREKCYLPNNKPMAEQRLQLLKKRLLQDGELLTKYRSTMQEYILSGHAQRVRREELDVRDCPVWYLPHHPVTHPLKPRKVRVVFDCVAKYHGTSVNQQLLQGPDLANPLVGVLIRFRQESIAIAADIEAMFHQVYVEPKDRDALRFLWWPNGDFNEEPREYCMVKHLFGATSSPSCANFCLKRTASIYQSEFDHVTVQVVKKNKPSYYYKNFVGRRWDGAVSLVNKIGFSGYGLEELPKLQAFQIERCFKPKDFGETKKVQLHIFSDGSRAGYEAVAYLRLVDVFDNIHCSFVMGKARLAPIHEITILRLELSAAVISVRLYQIISQEVEILIDRVKYWTDSTTVLKCLKNDTKRFHTFESNRLTKIRSISSTSDWRYVNRDENPADDASKGLRLDEMIKNQRWLSGPAFLRKEESCWPATIEVPPLKDSDPEVRKESRIYTTVAVQDSIGGLIHYYSSWWKLKKAFAWILRYKRFLQSKVCKQEVYDASPLISSGNVVGKLTALELQKAEEGIVRQVQKATFPKVFEVLGNISPGANKRLMKKTLKREGASIFQLNPKLRNGLLAVGGKLESAPVKGDLKYPYILPNDNHVTELIIRHNHANVGHMGQESVLSSLRERFWVIKGRSAVRRVLRKCVDCQKRKAPTGEQFMAKLPEDRITPHKPPFTYVGVDLFGPIEVKQKRSRVKRYGCIFTCLSVRAIHIEVANTLNTDSMINALRRFICLRGCPEEIRSDCGTNLTKADKELKESIEEWNQQRIDGFCAQRGIQWIFNPPGASHMGGAWERMIRSVRQILKALLKEQVVCDEVLHTVLTEATNILNSRPLTRNSNDVMDEEPLTPNHLLNLRPCSSLPPGIFDKEDLYCQRQWRQTQYLSNLFWKRWIGEYLPTLQERKKWNEAKENLKVGDVVLLADKNFPRGQWPHARIIEVFPNEDWLVRSARVKTSFTVMTRAKRQRQREVKTTVTTLVRPITKLCRLELSNS